MHLFIELFTFGAFVAIFAHAARTRGRSGVALLSALFLLGLLRENAVAIRALLYDFAPLTLNLGRAPLIATIIWGFSIYAALVFAEEVMGEAIGSRVSSPWTFGAVALFMVALVGFYEPFLAEIGMARWQEGTCATLGVPWIALIGYPTLAVGFLLLWEWAASRTIPLRLAILALGLPVLALGHAFGLQALKAALDW
ncbi:MAG TPA: hypothetical protein VGS22_15995 [Thermoanaerobaculia bacterium]|jgi:hypothetical protein|nr:hypothetical protein [Thermoanaerobaculia bacterium]